MLMGLWSAAEKLSTVRTFCKLLKNTLLKNSSEVSLWEKASDLLCLIQWRTTDKQNHLMASGNVLFKTFTDSVLHIEIERGSLAMKNRNTKCN